MFSGAISATNTLGDLGDLLRFAARTRTFCGAPILGEPLVPLGDALGEPLEEPLEEFLEARARFFEPKDIGLLLPTEAFKWVLRYCLYHNG